MQLIDEEIKSVIEIAYIKAKKAIEDNKQKINKIVDMLLEKEVVNAEELENIMKIDLETV